MQREESSIYISLLDLRNKLYSAQFLMTKADRMIYGDRLMIESADTLKNFILAFDIPQKRYEYLLECMAHFNVLRIDLDFITQKNIIHYKLGAKKDQEGNPIDKKDRINSQQVDLFRTIARIEEDIHKWWICYR